MMRSTLLLTIIVILSLCSACIAVRSSHRQIMDKKVMVSSSEEIIKTFGQPTEKMVEGPDEIWYYVLPKKLIINGFPSSPLDVMSLKADSSGNDQNSLLLDRAGKYRYYIRIKFQNEKPVGWFSEGVDFTVKERSKTLTGIAVGLGTLAVAIPVVLIIVISTSAM